MYLTKMLDGDYMVTCICRQIKFSCLYACIRRCILNINMRHVEIIFLVEIATLRRTTYLILNATVKISADVQEEVEVNNSKENQQMLNVISEIQKIESIV